MARRHRTAVASPEPTTAPVDADGFFAAEGSGSPDPLAPTEPPEPPDMGPETAREGAFPAPEPARGAEAVPAPETSGTPPGRGPVVPSGRYRALGSLRYRSRGGVECVIPPGGFVVDASAADLALFERLGEIALVEE